MVKIRMLVIAILATLALSGAANAGPATTDGLPIYDVEAVCKNWPPQALDACRMGEAVFKRWTEDFLSRGGFASKPYLLPYCVAFTDDPTTSLHVLEQPSYGKLSRCLMEQRGLRYAEKLRDTRDPLRKQPCQSTYCKLDEEWHKDMVMRTAGGVNEAAFDACLAHAEAANGGYEMMDHCLGKALEKQSVALNGSH